MVRYPQSYSFWIYFIEESSSELARQPHTGSKKSTLMRNKPSLRLFRQNKSEMKIVQYLDETSQKTSSSLKFLKLLVLASMRTTSQARAALANRAPLTVEKN